MSLTDIFAVYYMAGLVTFLLVVSTFRPRIVEQVEFSTLMAVGILTACLVVATWPLWLAAVLITHARRLR